MTKWDVLKERLGGVFCVVKAKVDEYELTFQKQRSGEKLVVAVFVNGVIKGEWSNVGSDGIPEHPEGQFWCPKKSRPWPLKQHRSLKKIYGKREADRMVAMRVICVLPSFNTPRTLVSHYRKHFPQLSLVCHKCGGDGQIEHPNISGHDYSERCQTCAGKGELYE